MKVLISAYACEPDKGSEPGVGWRWAKEISRFSDTWVMTRANNRSAIEQAVRDEGLEHIHFVYFDLPQWSRSWKRGRRGIHAYYYLWQLGSAWLAHRLHERVRFDLVHHLTLSAYWMPSGLAFLRAPMIWGPVGGAETVPLQLGRAVAGGGRLYEFGKRLTHLSARMDPLVRLTRNRSSLILMQTASARERMNGRMGAASAVYSAVGIDCDAVGRKRDRTAPTSRRGGLKVVSVGRLLAFKAFHLGIRAFAQLRAQAPESEYVIVGAGPEAGRLHRLVTDLGLSDAVRLEGSLPRERVLAAMHQSDVLLHPSFRDPPATVIAEAMAAGLPVICLNHGGPALQVTPDSGVRVEPGSETSVVGAMAEALLWLNVDRAALARLSDGARRRAVEEFDWRSKGRAIETIYRQMAARR